MRQNLSPVQVIETDNQVFQKKLPIGTSLEVKNDTYPKNLALATAFGCKELTLRKQKALHVIALTVRENFFLRNPTVTADNINQLTEKDIQNTNTTFNICETLVMQSMGYTDKTKYYSYGQVLEIFEEIADQTIGFDALGIVTDKSQKERWKGFTKILGSAEREDGYYVLNMPPKMVLRIVNPEISFRAPVSWEGYKTKFTPAIYETCMYYFQQGKRETDWFELDYIRRLTNAESSTFDDFTKLKSRVIDKAIDNIKTADELDLSIAYETDSFDHNPNQGIDTLTHTQKPRSKGRKKVTHIRFFVSEKTGHISGKDDLRTAMALSSIKTELESLGIAKNAIGNVINECQDNDGVVSVPYLKWCIRKGYELRQMDRYKPKFGDDEGNSHNFGGYFRKNVIRDRKADWLISHEVMLDYLIQNSSQITSYKVEECESNIPSLEMQCKKTIAGHYIKSLSETAFSYLKNDFVSFLETAMPAYYARYEQGESEQSVSGMAENCELPLFLYLDYRHQIFDANAFKFAILNKTPLKLVSV